MQARRVNNGFTLIEVVIALAILALSLGVLYETFGWGLRRTAQLREQESALLTAQSLLADVRARVALAPGVRSGRAAYGMIWEERVVLRDTKAAADLPLRAFAVMLEVRWGTRPAQRVQLRSIETARAAT
jgi:general secretion pathway protein I